MSTPDTRSSKEIAADLSLHVLRCEQDCTLLDAERRDTITQLRSLLSRKEIEEMGDVALEQDSPYDDLFRRTTALLQPRKDPPPRKRSRSSTKEFESGMPVHRDHFRR